MSSLERNDHPSRQSGCLLPRRPLLLSPVGPAGQSQHSGLKAQSRSAASYGLILVFVGRLELLDQLRIDKIRRDTLDDTRGFNIENLPRACARLASRLFCDEPDRVRFKLQPVLPLRSISQFGICEESSLGQDLVIIAYERPAVAKREFALLEALHKLSYPRSPLFSQTADTVDCRWLGKLANQTVRHESGSF